MSRTPIADMVAEMLSGGVAPDMIVLAVRTVELCSAREVDVVADRRRAYDRARKALLPSNWIDVTSAVFERDRYTCVYCGSQLVPLHCDHVVPLSRGGSSTENNLVTACQDCNLSKGARTPEEWGAS